MSDAADVPDTDTVANTPNTNSDSVADRSHVPHVSNVLGVVSLALGMMMVVFIFSDYFRLSSAHLVGDLHDGAAVAPVGVVGHVLDPAVGQRHGVLALDVAALVPGPGPIRDEYCDPVARCPPITAHLDSLKSVWW